MTSGLVRIGDKTVSGFDLAIHSCFYAFRFRCELFVVAFLFFLLRTFVRGVFPSVEALEDPTAFWPFLLALLPPVLLC